MSSRSLFRPLLALVLVVLVPTVSTADEGLAFFEKHVRPILSARCFKCHGPKKQKNGLRLDSRQSILKGSENGKVVVPGKPGKSVLVDAIHHRGELKMPPKVKLPKAELAAITKWVKIGLPWPETPDPKQPHLTGEALYKHLRSTHWSFRRIENPSPPKIKNNDWPRGPLDRFVLARLEAEGLSPSPPADRYTLIRRATFDLIGLPPTLAEVEAFVADRREDAYERLIDRLLASPRYGERWGRHWLDVARYADTRGYAFSRERRFPYAYTYRDYVIRAFNEDLPFDRFVTEQLAADLLDLKGDTRPLAALGFLTVGRKYNNVHDDIDDQIDVVSRGLLGLTVGCARCHEHKYDAIGMEDYYALYGVFVSSKPPKDLPLIGNPHDTPGYDTFKKELDRRQAALDKFAGKKRTEIVEHGRTKVADYLVRIISREPEESLFGTSLSKDELKPKLLTRWRTFIQRHAKPDDALWGVWAQLAKLKSENGDEALIQRAVQLAKQLRDAPAGKINPLLRDALVKQPPKTRQEVALLYGRQFLDVYQAWKKAGGKRESIAKLSPAKLPPAKLPPGGAELLDVLLADRTPTNVSADEIFKFLARLDRNKYRELERKIHEHQVRSAGAPPRAMSLVDVAKPVTPHVFLRGKSTRPGKSVPRRFLRLLAGENPRPFGDDTSGRLELAQAIVARDNPLTARVIVNRVWMHHMVTPLVATTSDFGARSEQPSNVQLLDHLAWSLAEDGWSLKRLHRRIMLSATYRQAGANRPECSQRDPDNRWYWRMHPRRLELEALRDSLLTVAGRLDLRMGGRPDDIFRTPGKGRRTIYGLVDRQKLPSLYRVFDFANPDQSSPRRPETTVPQQALFLMNSPQVIELAKAVAAQTVGDGAAGERIRRLYGRVFARRPTADEVAAGEAFLKEADKHKTAKDKLSSWDQYAQVLLSSNLFMFVD